MGLVFFAPAGLCLDMVLYKEVSNEHGRFGDCACHGSLLAYFQQQGSSLTCLQQQGSALT